MTSRSYVQPGTLSCTKPSRSTYCLKCHEMTDASFEFSSYKKTSYKYMALDTSMYQAQLLRGMNSSRQQLRRGRTRG
ncbi:hypothetical protein KC19_5G028900 [Ceratodon purpureus]|uniref:Uncharacterized protein n=1 Tax=Ceratodon purpureus TaxID=3225 RepID=A0A8T0HXB2_CERPU|nr:hypothetical protein KC19_5G028900 [Ceratodon purpureus]